jgi:hypothetical protein
MREREPQSAFDYYEVRCPLGWPEKHKMLYTEGHPVRGYSIDL